MNHWLEHVCVVVGVLALNGAHQSLKAHARVDDIHGELLQRAVGLAVELHEHQVPDFDDLWVVLVDEFSSGHLRFLLGRAAVQMDFGARATRSGVAHLPEVVVLVAVDDVVGRHVLQPESGGLVVAFQSFGGIALEDCHVQVFGLELQYVHQILPSHVDGALLEVVAKRPVSQHLEHGVVVCVVAHLFQVVVFSTHAQAFLRVCAAAWVRIARAQYNVFPLVHASVGEHQCGVVFDNHRCRVHNGVLFLLEELLERVANLIGCHHDSICIFLFTLNKLQR